MKNIIGVWILIFFSVNLYAQRNKSKDTEKKSDFLLRDIVVYENEDSLGFIRAYEKNTKKWGFIDNDTNVLIPFVYDQLSLFDPKGTAIAKIEKKAGAINRRNRILIPFKYLELGTFTESKTYAKKGKKYGYITRNNTEIVPFIYEEAENFNGCRLAKIMSDGMYGFINFRGREVIPPEYSNVDQSYSPKDPFVLIKEDNRWAFFSPKGKKLTYFEFDKVEKTYNKTDGYGYLVNGLVLIRQGTQSAYVTVEDSLSFIVPFGRFPYAQPFNQYRWALVGRIGKYGAIDEFGETKIPIEYDTIYEARIKPGEEDFKALIVRKENVFGLLDTNGNEITKVDYKSVFADYYYTDSELKEFFHLRNSDNREGVVDLKGDVRIPFQYQWIDKFSGKDVVFALKNNRYGLIDTANRIITNFIYDEYLGYYNNFFPVRKNAEYGAINDRGEEVIPFEYENMEACLYNDRKWIVSKKGKTGIINSKNEVIIPFEYDSVFNWSQDGCRDHIVYKDKKYGIVDTLGKIVIPIVYDDLKFYNKSCICVAQNGKYGMINRKNEVQIPLRFDAIYVDNYWWSFKEDYICVKEGNKYYEISKEGRLGNEISENEIKKAFWHYLSD